MPALADADSSDSPTSLAALLPDRQALASAEQDLADTSTAVDELKSQLAAAEKRADVQRKRVEKKRAKLQRRLERERSKRVRPRLLSLPYPPPPFPSARRRRQLTLVESLAAVGPGGPSVQGQEARRQAGQGAQDQGPDARPERLGVAGERALQRRRRFWTLITESARGSSARVASSGPSQIHLSLVLLLLHAPPRSHLDECVYEHALREGWKEKLDRQGLFARPSSRSKVRRERSNESTLTPHPLARLAQAGMGSCTSARSVRIESAPRREPGRACSIRPPAGLANRYCSLAAFGHPQRISPCPRMLNSDPAKASQSAQRPHQASPSAL